MRIWEDTHINEDLPYKEKTCYASIGVWFYIIMKTQRPLENRYT